MRKLLKAVMLSAVIFSSVGAQTWDCGKTKWKVTATLSEGTLTIKGIGPMRGRECEVECSPLPWDESGKSITNVVIENGVTSIGEGAFSSTSLKTVTIPKSVKSIGSGAFGWGAYGVKLVSIDVAAGNANYSSENGILFNNDRTTLLIYPAGKTGTSYAIPNSVKSIGENAFARCTVLTSVAIPNGVTSIPYGAFEGCTGLTSVSIGNSVKSIEADAFLGCVSLKSVTIPNSVEVIEGGNDYNTGGAFAGCEGLTSITFGNSVKSIGSEAFRACSGLKSVTLPKSIEYVGLQAFAACTGLTSVTVLNPVPPKPGEHIFDNEKDMTKVCLYVPSGRISAYRAAEGWNQFSCVKEAESR